MSHELNPSLDSKHICTLQMHLHCLVTIPPDYCDCHQFNSLSKPHYMFCLKLRNSSFFAKRIRLSE